MFLLLLLYHIPTKTQGLGVNFAPPPCYILTMEWTDSLILGILQGITEFLPISSSGHLVLGEHFLSLNVDQLKSFDVVVHMGTLLAILVYFRDDLWGMIKSFFAVFAGKIDKKDPYLKLILLIIIGTIPAVIVGLTLEDHIDSAFRNIEAVGIFMLIMGIVFLLGEFVYKRVHKKAPIAEKVMEKVDAVKDVLKPGGFHSAEVRMLTFRKAIIIGCAQAMALIPGISRSGSTIVAGLFQGINRSAAARFSFLLGVPAIFGAGLLTGIDVVGSGELINIGVLPLIIGFVSSFLLGVVSVYFLMHFLKRHSLKVFSVYLIALGLSTFL